MTFTEDAARRRVLEWMQTIHFACNLVTMFAVVAFVVVSLNQGLKLKNATVDYIENRNLTAYIAAQLTKIDTILSNINGTSGDVRIIARSSAAAVDDGTVGDSVRSVVNATTRFPEMPGALVAEFIGNATRLLGTVASVNFSVVTDVLADAHNAKTQRVVRERIDHALRSFDFATLGITQMFGTLGRAMAGNPVIVDAPSEVASVG